MFCAISGTSPLHPVVSTKSGLVYEKDLILKYLRDNDGKDPITGETLDQAELIDVKTAPSAPAPPPRPPTLSSVPALLHVLQNEWDSTMLESLELRKQNATLRQELSHALYKEDAMIRVLARISRERDEAREALASVRAGMGGASAAAPATQNGGDGGPAEVDVEMAESGLSPQLIERIDTTVATLSGPRRKRKVPAGYATAADLKSYAPVSTIPSLHSTKPPGITCLDVAGPTGSLVVTGGMDKTVQIYDRAEDKVLATLKGHTKKVNAVAVVNGSGSTAENLPAMIAAASADKTVKVWSANEPGSKSAYTLAATLTPHGGEVSSLSVHPSNTLLLSGSLDGSWAVHDLADPSGKPTTVLTGSAEVGVTSATWHVDGQLFALGSTDGSVRVVDVKTASIAATFSSSGSEEPVVSLSSSENGYILASLSPSTLRIWDLRKMTESHQMAVVEAKVATWDPSAQFILVGGKEVKGFQYKTWEEVLSFDGNAADVTGIKLVDGGKQLVLGGMDRTVRVLAKPA